MFTSDMATNIKLLQIKLLDGTNIGRVIYKAEQPGLLGVQGPHKRSLCLTKYKVKQRKRVLPLQCETAFWQHLRKLPLWDHFLPQPVRGLSSVGQKDGCVRSAQEPRMS